MEMSAGDGGMSLTSVGNATSSVRGKRWFTLERSLAEVLLLPGHSRNDWDSL